MKFKTREELMAMNKKDLKARLADLGKMAKDLSGKDLTDAMDEAKIIGEILDEIKGREELMAAAMAAGADDPMDDGKKPGESGAEPKNQARAKSGKALKDGKAVSYQAKVLVNPRNAMTTEGVVLPQHSSPEISPAFNNVSSLIDRVKTVPLPGGESYKRPYVVSYGDGAGSTAENADYNVSEPEFNYAEIVREKITAYAEEPEEMVKLPDADYDSVVEESVTRAIKRYASRQILVGPGGTGKFRGIFFNPTEAKEQVIDPATDITTITAIDDGTLDEIIYSRWGREYGRYCRAYPQQERSQKFAKLQTRGRKVYTIKNHGTLEPLMKCLNSSIPHVLKSACGRQLRNGTTFKQLRGCHFLILMQENPSITIQAGTDCLPCGCVHGRKRVAKTALSV